MKYSTIVLWFYFLVVPAAFAEDDHEISGATQAIVKAAPFGALNTFQNINAFAGNLGVGYAYRIVSPVQMAISLDFAYGQVLSITALGLTALAGPIFNIPIDDRLWSSPFLALLAGIHLEGITGSRLLTDVAFNAVIGSRFKLTDHIVYRPEIFATKIGAGYITFGATLLSFSLLF